MLSGEVHILPFLMTIDQVNPLGKRVFLVNMIAAELAVFGCVPQVHRSLVVAGTLELCAVVARDGVGGVSRHGERMCRLLLVERHTSKSRADVRQAG